MGSKPPADNSARVAEIEAQAAREAREAEEQRKAQEKADFEARLQAAHSNAIQSALGYFQSQGANPDEYVDEISQRAAAIRGTVPSLDAAPGSYYDNLGQLVYEGERDARRAGFMRDIDTFAPTGFATRRITDEADDPIIESILEERQNTAENYIRNLLDRGVVTTPGYEAAVKDLTRQRAGAKSQLSEIGLAELERGRAKAQDIANEARSTASNIDLTQFYDPYEYSGRLNSAFENFFTGLGERIRGFAPENLFDTTGLAGIAGASQGAGNTKFDPNALAGLTEEDDEDENRSQVTNPF